MQDQNVMLSQQLHGLVEVWGPRSKSRKAGFILTSRQPVMCPLGTAERLHSGFAAQFSGCDEIKVKLLTEYEVGVFAHNQNTGIRLASATELATGLLGVVPVDSIIRYWNPRDMGGAECFRVQLSKTSSPPRSWVDIPSPGAGDCLLPPAVRDPLADITAQCQRLAVENSQLRSTVACTSQALFEAQTANMRLQAQLQGVGQVRQQAAPLSLSTSVAERTDGLWIPAPCSFDALMGQVAYPTTAGGTAACAGATGKVELTFSGADGYGANSFEGMVEV
ncbi:hypothetical protein JKP88DRAFT_273074 [Tribonema minus]|uniref:Uncharacterized protein n=1 Tax=Tribonema minus TaxID=303371 RepID=A0A836CEW7_9STRA|nr:hypothetical protein JKP88DRAFT_273074 [Tribonema minus]